MVHLCRTESRLRRRKRHLRASRQEDPLQIARNLPLLQRSFKRLATPLQSPRTPLAKIFQNGFFLKRSIFFLKPDDAIQRGYFKLAARKFESAGNEGEGVGGCGVGNAVRFRLRFSAGRETGKLADGGKHVCGVFAQFLIFRREADSQTLAASTPS